MIESGRSLLLKLYTRLERPLLLWNYRVVRSRLAWWPPLRWLISRLFLRPLSSAGAIGRPMTLDEAKQMAQRAARAGALAIGPCGCRSVHHGCSHPVRTDVLIYAGVPAWSATFPQQYKPATAAEVVALFEACRRQDMIQVAWRSGMGGGSYAICNCCADGCVPLLNRRFDPSYRYEAGAFVATVDMTRCTACGICTSVCPFGAAVPASGNVAGCLGCGLCAERCPAGAIEMMRRPASAGSTRTSAG